MSELDLIDRAVITASPERVWAALSSEFHGARAWWTPWNTFEAGDVPPEVVGGLTRVTVHPKGVGQGGPTLPFGARTRLVEPHRRWAMDYVDGVFRGSCEFSLAPLADGAATELSMAFRAQPRDLAAILSRVVDLGYEHSKGFQGAAANLQRLIGDTSSPAAPTVEVVPLTTGLARRTRHTIRTDDGAELAVTSWAPGTTGEPPTAVLVHGWGATSQVWSRSCQRLLAAGWAVLTLDLRGHGGSSLGAEPLTIERLGHDLGIVLETLDVGGAALVGHSGGGFAALSYGAGDREHFAKHVSSIVLVSTAARDRGASSVEVAMMGHPIFSGALRRRGLGARLLGQMTGSGASAELLEANRALFAATDPSVRAATFRASQHVDLDVSDLGAPAVVLSGAEDKIVSPAASEELARQLPLGQFRTVAGAGHMLPLEAPEAIVDAVGDLLVAAV